ncbi:hypothetical protein F4604DRAFT_1932527 [Suillus subluteus]|nr:hypothetical protein F4604DRAFT_1932527 [Suillus subluteus]
MLYDSLEIALLHLLHQATPPPYFNTRLFYKYRKQLLVVICAVHNVKLSRFALSAFNPSHAGALLAHVGNANEEVNYLLDVLRIIRGPTTENMVVRQPLVKPETEQLRGKSFSWLLQWVSTFQRSHSLEKDFVPFIS